MTWKKSITPQDVVDLLNEAVRLDSVAMRALIEQRVPCSEAFAEHPSVQCGRHGGVLKVGMLGILNGLFGEYKHWGCIAAEFQVVCETSDCEITYLQRDGSEDPRIKGLRVGDRCPVCNEPLVLGRLTGFCVLTEADVEKWTTKEPA